MYTVKVKNILIIVRKKAKIRNQILYSSSLHIPHLCTLKVKYSNNSKEEGKDQESDPLFKYPAHPTPMYTVKVKII